MSEKKEFLTPLHPFGHYGYKAYQIRFRRNEFGLFQRHEWQRENDTFEIEEWIPAAGQTIPKHAVEV